MLKSKTILDQLATRLPTQPKSLAYPTSQTPTWALPTSSTTRTFPLTLSSLKLTTPAKISSGTALLTIFIEMRG